MEVHLLIVWTGPNEVVGLGEGFDQATIEPGSVSVGRSTHVLIDFIINPS